MAKKNTNPSADSVDFLEFSAHLQGVNDRDCAILAGAYVDEALLCLIREKMPNPSEELFRYDGPIGSFSARIRLARALDWISEELRHDLDIIRAIRNDFAHVFVELDFENEVIKSKCNSLKIAEHYTNALKPILPMATKAMSAEFFWSKAKTPRGLFIFSAFAAFGTMQARSPYMPFVKQAFSRAIEDLANDMKSITDK